mmetsp:Transcript_27388/g.84938  ORF Transcript_27388/g.84938 Transcript_27388/m.84938 type:complete len:277 (+) Transcript_27388:2755-3585(+)
MSSVIMATLKMPLILSMSVSTTILRPRLRLITRSGRRARNVRSTFRKPTSATPRSAQPRIEMMTMQKSSTFHASRRYAVGCSTKPKATTLMHISTTKMTVKTSPVTSSAWLVELLGRRGSSMASSNELTTMQIMMKLSNHGELLMAVHAMRMGFLRPKMKRDTPPLVIVSPGTLARVYVASAQPNWSSPTRKLSTSSSSLSAALRESHERASRCSSKSSPSSRPVSHARPNRSSMYDAVGCARPWPIRARVAFLSSSRTSLLITACLALRTCTRSQ